MASYQFLVNIYRRYFETMIPYTLLLALYKLGAFPFLKKNTTQMLDYYDKLNLKEPLEPELEEVLA